jgi:hypothetical protein
LRPSELRLQGADAAAEARRARLTVRVDQDLASLSRESDCAGFQERVGIRLQQDLQVKAFVGSVDGGAGEVAHVRISMIGSAAVPHLIAKQSRRRFG